MSYFLTEDDIKNICYEYAKAHLSYDEPFSVFEDRYEGLLETALFAPQKSFGGSMIYPYLHQQAAILFYEMIKLHPFVNGNKRVACVSLMTFLAMNEKWIVTDWMTLYKIAKSVAESKASDRNNELRLLSEAFEKLIRDLPKNP